MRGNNKVFPYVVVLKQKNRRSVEAIGLIAGFIFVMITLQRTLANEQPLAYGPLTLAGAGLLIFNFNLFRTRRKTQLTPLLLVAGLSLLLPSTFLGISFLILALLAKAALTPQEIGFSDDEIVFSGIFPRKVQWAALSNVLIKDGLLTMDYKNNKLFQKETDDLDDDEDDEVSEEEFNAYCRSRLSN